MDRSKLVREGSIYLGIYLLLIFLTLWLPFIGMFTMILLPIPFILFTKISDIKLAILFGLLAFFILFIVIGPIALPLSITFIVPGIVIGELYRRKKDAFGVLLGGSLSFISVIILNYIGSILLLDVNPIQVLQGLIRESMEMTEEMMGFLGGQDEALELAYGFIDELSVIAPSLFIIFGVGMAFIVQWLASRVMKKLNYDIEKFLPLRTWSFPRAFIWYYLLTYIIVFTRPDEGTALYTVVANLTPILEIVMIIQGFAFMFFFFHNKGRTKVIPIIILILSFLLPFLLYIVRILGIIDLGFELRKRMNSQK